MSSCNSLPILGASAYAEALLACPRPGADAVLAFYDHRVGAVCTDPRLLLIPLDDHICHRGDGLFESICYRQRKVFAFDGHLARLQDGAKALCITPPCPWEEVRHIILGVAAASGRDNGDLRVFLSRGPGGFGVSPSQCPVAGLYVVALAAREPDASVYAKGLSAFTSEIPPKQEYLARIKNTNYLPNVFMAAEARRKGMDVAVTFDERGVMAEAAIANMGIVDAGGRLVSPEIRRILPGTTLLAALELAREHMEVVLEDITHEDILAAREVLLFTSATLIQSVTSFDGKDIGQGEHRGKPGPVAQWLREKLLAHMLATGAPF